MLSFKVFSVTAVLFLLFRASTVMSAAPKDEDCLQESKLLDSALKEDEVLIRNYRTLKLLESASMDIKAVFYLTEGNQTERVVVPKNVTEDYKFIAFVYTLLTASDDFKISNEELSKVDTSMLIRCQINRNTFQNMLLNQWNLLKILPFTDDLVKTAFTTNFFGDVCMTSDYCGEKSNDPYYYVFLPKLHDLKSYHFNYQPAGNLFIYANIRLCEKDGGGKCSRFTFNVPYGVSSRGYYGAEPGKEIHMHVVRFLANPVYGMNVRLLKDVFVKKTK